MSKGVSVRSGFSLVEVALALLVAAVGLMSVMGMFPMGMEASRKAIDEGQAALFAQEIFNGFRAKIVMTNTAWSSVDSLKIGVPSPSMWSNGDTIEFQANHSGTNIYEYKYETDMKDYAVRYVMTVRDSLSVPGVKYMRLTLANGEYGGSLSNGLVFYTEIFRTGH
jgi:uncharacterized protein (TIGR02598 family)